MIDKVLRLEGADEGTVKPTEDEEKEEKKEGEEE